MAESIVVSHPGKAVKRDLYLVRLLLAKGTRGTSPFCPLKNWDIHGHAQESRRAATKCARRQGHGRDISHVHDTTARDENILVLNKVGIGSGTKVHQTRLSSYVHLHTPMPRKAVAASGAADSAEPRRSSRIKELPKAEPTSVKKAAKPRAKKADKEKEKDSEEKPEPADAAKEEKPKSARGKKRKEADGEANGATEGETENDDAAEPPSSKRVCFSSLP